MCVEAQSTDDRFKTDKLERDIGHGRDDARERDGEREATVAVAAFDEIGCGDETVFPRNGPHARKDHKDHRIDEDRIGHGKEAECACGEDGGRHGDEGVSRIEIAAEQEPCDDGAEALAAEPPFIDVIEIACSPTRGGKTHDGDERKEPCENVCRCPLHDAYSSSSLLVAK